MTWPMWSALTINIVGQSTLHSIDVVLCGSCCLQDRCHVQGIADICLDLSAFECSRIVKISLSPMMTLMGGVSFMCSVNFMEFFFGI